jgi:thioredoxin 1
MPHPAAVNDETFDEKVLQAERPVLVDFTAAWCVPCQMIVPVIEDVSAAYAGKVDVFTMDVDANPKTRERFGVRGIPRFIVFKNGQIAASLHSALTSRSAFAAALDKALEAV